MKKTRIPQEIAPRLEEGVDYSGPGLVLVRGPLGRLVWRKGGTYWGGAGQPRAYARACLQFISNQKGFGKEVRDIAEGRLSQILISEHIDTIKRYLGVSYLYPDEIDIKKTLVIEG